MVLALNADGIMPFGMESGRVGPFVNVQLTLIFALNFFMMGLRVL